MHPLTPPSVSVSPECISTFNELKLGKDIKWIIYKISDDWKEIVVEESFQEGQLRGLPREAPERKEQKTARARRASAAVMPYSMSSTSSSLARALGTRLPSSAGYPMIRRNTPA
ncbi:hypothetical protein SNOG_16474 [Parastagonospora nodorum SN15]|uniref:ADF-H domain-containing protein n=1 Tax=Phaeosphaeria nodorum (strain SN15 / ATCC MYA-4574 / FGSC 10173) TaxID=321614 RepID=Q0TVJ0_PHANO|nr:hypothetical protein SNOG_16474 [Parastagonospora nodorum SN15]EAT76172.2 hypothetical protein SNOG_16474 [Parastagonospora nodorum SN15]